MCFFLFLLQTTGCVQIKIQSTTKRKNVSPVLVHGSHPIVSRAIYRPFIAHPMTDTLTVAGLREMAQSAVQYRGVFIKRRAAYKPF